MQRSVSLSLAAVDMLSQVLAVNCRQFPFQIPSFGQFEEDRQRIAMAVCADLANRGLIRHNEIAEDVVTALTVTSDNDVSVAMTGTLEDGGAVHARASAAGSAAVLAVSQGQTIRFDLISPAALARSLVALLPTMAAGPGQSVQVVQAAPAPESDGITQQVRATRSTSQAQLVIAATMLERPRKGSGFFAVTTRGRHGREVDAGNLGWIDTDAGRYLVLSTPGEDGEIRATYSPADSTRLAQQLETLTNSPRPGADA